MCKTLPRAKITSPLSHGEKLLGTCKKYSSGHKESWQELRVSKNTHKKQNKTNNTQKKRKKTKTLNQI